MIICTNTGIKLTGLDARKFIEQVEKAEPNTAAIETAKRGRELIKELNETGRVYIVKH